MRPARTWIALAVVLAAGALQGAGTPSPKDVDAIGEAAALPGPYEAGERLYDWVDAARDRPVPVKVYYPLDATGPRHAIVLSHGLGGSREGYAYLGKHWASHGYVSIHVQHVGSDDSVWRGAGDAMRAMRKAITADNALARPRDAAFALDQLTVIAQDLGLDMVWGEAGIAGHSFGAHTALLCAGMGRGLLADPRFAAAVAMSPSAPERDKAGRAFDSVSIPCFHMTGTEDVSVIRDTKPEQRRIPFDRIEGVDQYLLTFLGGDHMVFSGRPRHWGAKPTDAAFQESIKRCATVYWNAYLRDNLEAKAWLRGDGMRDALAGQARLERKLE